jgi:DNA polymerase III alpha subunit (gram-positive type)
MNYIFLDTETTGLLHSVHDVWEIAYAINNGPIHSSFVEHDIESADPKALEINGYKDRFKGLPQFPQLFEMNLQEAGKNATLVAANPAFDNGFLVARWGFRPWQYRMLDISTYAMPYFDWKIPEGLATVAKCLDISAPDHTAAEDVNVLRQCFYKLAHAYEFGE